MQSVPAAAVYVQSEPPRQGGIGVVWENEGNKLAVFTLVKDGPAHRSGRIQKGDRLLKVNHVNLHDIEQARSLLGGPAGSIVTLTLVETANVSVLFFCTCEDLVFLCMQIRLSPNISPPRPKN